MTRTYAKVVAVVLLALSAVGIVSLGWNVGEIVYHTALGLLFAYAGFRLKNSSDVRMMVGSLGVLLIEITAVEILAIWFSPLHLALYLHEITSLVVGAGSLLAYRYLPADSPESQENEKGE